MFTLKDARKEFKFIGYQLKTKRNSQFIETDIIHKETGYRLGSILSKDDYNFFKPAIDLREKFKGNLYENENQLSMRVVL